MARYENLSVGQLEAETILGSDVFRKKIFLDPTNGSDGNDGLAIEKSCKTLSVAKGKITTGRNDAIILVPGSSGLSLAADPALDFNCTSLIGGGPPEGLMNQRARIGMSTTFTPFMTISGYGNLFKNFYTMHGTAITDLVGLLISGARNVFDHVHFGGPMVAAQAGDSGYIGVHVTGSENRFKNCVFGVDTIGRDEASPNVQLGPGTLTFFEDCLFLLNLADGDPLFFKVLNTSGYTWALFKRCIFMAFNSNYATAETVAFKFTGGSSCAMVFDNECMFQNVTALCDAAEDQYIWMPRSFTSTTDTEGMIAVKLAI